MVDPAHHDTPVFLHVNMLMTGVWGTVFTVNALLNYLVLALPGQAGLAASLGTYVFLAAGIVFTLWYPGHIRRKYAHASPGRQ